MPPRLTPRLIANICTRLRAGAFEQVAVESAGASYEQYQAWLRSGRRKGARGLPRQLADGVREAVAHARFMAEMDLRQSDARVWLLHGPGRDTAGQAGWGAASSPHETEGVTAAELEAEWRELLAELRTALEPYPEARQAAAAAIERWERKRRAKN
jgi:hypothetical protein